MRSLTALQNVPSECIIIPDDPPEPHKPTETYSKGKFVCFTVCYVGVEASSNFWKIFSNKKS